VWAQQQRELLAKARQQRRLAHAGRAENQDVLALRVQLFEPRKFLSPAHERKRQPRWIGRTRRLHDSLPLQKALIR
jgi:thiamine kinase-like enzyme